MSDDTETPETFRDSFKGGLVPAPAGEAESAAQIFNSQWLTPSLALKYMSGVWDEPTKMRWIFDRLKAGIIVSVARSGPHPDYGIMNFVKVPKEYWGHLEHPSKPHFWKTGDAKFRLPVRPSGHVEFSFFDIRFSPTTGDSDVPTAAEGVPAFEIELRETPVPPSQSPPAQAPNKGGRPRKEYWEDAIVEMFDQLFHGALIPKTQADIEGAMADWIYKKHDDRPSEQSIRSRASKIWKVHKKEG